jgi:D-3-phosphoglycerate dehydrogenase
MKKVVLTHRLYETGMEILKDKVNIKITNNGDPEVMLPELLDADGLIIRIGSIDRKTMMAAKNLKVIGRPAVGVDCIDVKTATELGIPIVYAPGGNTRSVAEHTLMLILAAAKDLMVCHAKTRQGEYNVRNRYQAFELLGKNLGIIGFGNIGREVAKLCSSIGMSVTVYHPFVKPELVKAEGYNFTNRLDELLACSDVVTIHTPLTKETKGLIGERELKIMKESAVLINCARGGIVDEKALFNALKHNKILGAAVDLLEEEPVSKENPLLKLDNIIITPHMAALTKEASSKVSRMAAEGVLAVLNGEKWPCVYNKEAYDHPRWK